MLVFRRPAADDPVAVGLDFSNIFGSLRQDLDQTDPGRLGSAARSGQGLLGRPSVWELSVAADAVAVAAGNHVAVAADAVAAGNHVAVAADTDADGVRVQPGAVF